MKTLLIYDKKGTIWVNITGSYPLPDGLPYLESEIPEGYYPESVNPKTKEPVWEALPKNETERRLEELEAQLAAMTGTEE